MIKAFLFDMDGVITETNREHFEAWRELASEIGINIDLKFNENLKGVSRRESLGKILTYGGMENSFSNDEIEAMMEVKNTHYLSLINQFTRKNLYPGIYTLLCKIKDSGRKSILTSASRNAPMLLEKLDIADLFDDVVNPVEVRGKPHPDIFLKGAELAGVTPIESIGIEDAQSGIDAIKSAGMKAIAIGHHLKGADYYFKSPKELLDNIDNLY